MSEGGTSCVCAETDKPKQDSAAEEEGHAAALPDSNTNMDDDDAGEWATVESKTGRKRVNSKENYNSHEQHQVPAAQEQGGATNQEQRPVTDEQLQQALGEIVEENLASFEFVSTVGTRLKMTPPTIAKEVINKLVTLLRESSASHATDPTPIFNQILLEHNVAPIPDVTPAPAKPPLSNTNNSFDTSSSDAPAELQRASSNQSTQSISTPRTPGAMLATHYYSILLTILQVQYLQLSGRRWG